MYNKREGFFMEKCQYCDYQTDSKIKFAKHVLHEHKQNRQTYLIQTKYKGTQPTCKCGCGELMKYNPVLSDFPSYNKKHLKTILKDKTFEEIWGDPKSEKRVKAISEARKQRFTSGEYDYIKDAIQEARKDPELGNKISKGAKGIPKPKPEGFGVGRVQSKETCKKMSDSAVQRIIKTDQLHTSKLEEKFKLILDILDIKYQHSFYAKSIKAFYDFYLPEYNILIETDGDFWHCHPIKFPQAQYSTQQKNIIRDQEKNKWAEENGYKLLRFWEDDINNNIKQVKQILLENLK
jgi:G:T-mismatch repair DNA endonuclease (very short patch repair protein)